MTTRIVNFLKGLPDYRETSVLELMNQQRLDSRSQIGFDLLKQLSETGRLHFATSDGLLENKKFRSGLFARVFHEIGTIRCHNGQTIAVGEFGHRVAAQMTRLARS